MSGLGQPEQSQRTINVEANLLAERIEEQNRRFIVARRRLVILVGIFVLGGSTLPPAMRLHGDAQTRLLEAKATSKLLLEESNALDLRVQTEQPKLDVDALQKSSQRNAEIFVGQMTAVLNSVQPDMALARIKCEVLSGQLTMTGAADAITYSAAQRFIEEVSRTPRTSQALLVSAKRNDFLSHGGVGFEFLRKSTVGGGA